MKDLAVGDGKAKIKGALALPKLDVGTLTLAAEAKDGTLQITKLVAGGKDVEVQGDGRITMRDGASDSLADAQVRFKVNDGYRNKSDITKSLFGAPGSKAPALFELADPKVKQSKRADGFYAWTLRGPLGRLEFIPAGGGGLTPSAFPGWRAEGQSVTTVAASGRRGAPAAAPGLAASDCSMRRDRRGSGPGRACAVARRGSTTSSSRTSATLPSSRTWCRPSR